MGDVTVIPTCRQQAFNWVGHYRQASIESETTAATLGKAGVRKFNIMANQDFVSVPLSRLKQSQFGQTLDNPPAIFRSTIFAG